MTINKGRLLKKNEEEKLMDKETQIHDQFHKSSNERYIRAANEDPRQTAEEEKELGLRMNYTRI